MLQGLVPQGLVLQDLVVPSQVLLAFLLAPVPAGAFWGLGSLDGAWRVTSGQVSYRVRHFMHDAQGVSQQIAGSAHCAAPTCTLALRVPVASFVSSDPDRDRDMQAATQAVAHPRVSVQGSLRLASAEAGEAVLMITLAGATRRLAGIPVQIDRSWDEARVTARFALSLRDFGIEPPALLGIPIKDEVRIDVDLRLHRD
jgi:hypothetical protein